MESFSGRVAVLGAGKMGEVLAAGMVRSGIDAARVLVTDVDSGRVAGVAARHGLSVGESNRSAAEQAEIVVIAVKPKDVGSVLAEISPAVTDSHLVVSIAAGITTAFLEEKVPTAPVVRAMPNIAAQVGEGITAICAGRRAGERHLTLACNVLEGVGPVLVVEEPYIDAVTALSGSGPAYFALFAEAMIDAGVTVGLARPVAAKLVAQTLRGTAALVTDGGMLPAEVREAVTSPGGTTAAALRELERAGVRAAVMNAVQAALDRARGLGAG
ncbi:MAG TPA: pyrroline-5-carboxylate reductase [Actinomycetota bacterium]|nr:pyrroline-5-carboxylate reductase [Actinomycetota bacterium]